MAKAEALVALINACCWAIEASMSGGAPGLQTVPLPARLSFSFYWKQVYHASILHERGYSCKYSTSIYVLRHKRFKKVDHKLITKIASLPSFIRLFDRFQDLQLISWRGVTIDHADGLRGVPQALRHDDNGVSTVEQHRGSRVTQPVDGDVGSRKVLQARRKEISTVDSQGRLPVRVMKTRLSKLHL